MTAKESKKKGSMESKLKRVSELVSGEEGVRTDTGEKVYFSSRPKIHTSQGFTEDKMLVTVPLQRDKEIRDRKTGELLYTKKELANFVITSDRELIFPSDKYFTDSGLNAEFPEMVLDERWSAASIGEYYQKGGDADPKGVFKKLQDIWKHFMDLEGNPGAYTALPLIDALSYCIWLFEYAPYLKYEGEKGSSKSKACEIHEYIDFNAFSGVDQTPAVIYRTLQDTRGTMIFDEAENYDKLSNKSDYEQAREAIINAGFKINGKVSRMESRNGVFTKVDYSVFGIKIFGSIHGVSETIRDRSFQIMLRKTLNRELSKRTPKARDPLFQQIRDELYIMTLNHWKEIREISERDDLENRLNLIGREWDKAKPLIVMATFFASHDNEHGQEILDDLWVFLEDQRKREISLVIDTFDELVIIEVESFLVNQCNREGIEITDDRNITLTLGDLSLNIAEKEGKRDSRNFNLRTYSKAIRKKIERLGLGVDFRHGTHNTTVFTSNLLLVRNAKKRFNLGSAESKNDGVINSINLNNLFNQINLFNSWVNQVNQKDLENIFINLNLTLENTKSLNDGLKKLIKLISGSREKVGIEGQKNNHEIVNSDVSNEKYITENQGKEIVNKLVDEGFHISPSDTGISTDGKIFKIAIFVNYYRTHTEEIDKRMRDLGFVTSNKGAFNCIIFNRPLRGDPQ